MKIPGLSDAQRADLNRRLGEPYSLDSSLQSLWAIERIFETLRRAPCLAEQATWIPTYLANVIERAWSEMGLTVTRAAANELSTASPAYRAEVDFDCQRLLQPPAAMPTLFGTRFLAVSGLGAMCTPWYGLASVLQNHTWAHASHDMIGRLRDHLDRGVPWLSREQARVVKAPALTEGAQRITRAMVWPPFAYTMNDTGELNRAQLQKVCAALPPVERAEILRALACSQDDTISLMAAWAMVTFDVPPAQPLEARAVGRATRFYRLATTPPAVGAQINALAAPTPPILEGVNEPRYAQASELSRSKPSASRALLDELVSEFPQRPVYACLRGFVREALDDQVGALSDYDRAIALEPRYVQALMNRGVLYSRQKRFEQSDSDLYAIRALDPDNADARNNLLLSYFFRLRGDVPMHRLPSPPPAPQHPNAAQAPAAQARAAQPARAAAGGRSRQAPAVASPASGRSTGVVPDMGSFRNSPKKFELTSYRLEFAERRYLEITVDKPFSSGLLCDVIRLDQTIMTLQTAKVWRLTLRLGEATRPTLPDLHWFVKKVLTPGASHGVTHSLIQLSPSAFAQLGPHAPALNGASPVVITMVGTQSDADRWHAERSTEPGGVSPTLMQQARTAHAAGKKLDAIKLVLLAYGCSIGHAKNAVERM